MLIISKNDFDQILNPVGVIDLGYKILIFQILAAISNFGGNQKC